MSEMLLNISSEIDQTDMKLSGIKNDLSEYKLLTYGKGSMSGIVDTPANIQGSGGQEPQSGDGAVCGLNKAEITYDTNQPINNARVDNIEQEDNQLNEWTTLWA